MNAIVFLDRLCDTFLEAKLSTSITVTLTQGDFEKVSESLNPYKSSAVEQTEDAITVTYRGFNINLIKIGFSLSHLHI